LFRNAVSRNCQVFFPYVSFVFYVLLFCNVLGLFPFTYTVTVSFLLTGIVSTASCLMLLLVSLISFKSRFSYLFLPKEIPDNVLKFLVLIEFFSYFTRFISLPVRLLANLLAGHCLLKILFGFVWVSVCGVVTGVNLVIKSVGLVLQLAGLFVIISLELFVSFLQAYIFVFLLTIYLDQALTINKHY
jgi:ATP synthase subunit 6